jgi:hypothetical protein
MSKKIRQLKKVLRLLQAPAHAQSLLAALKQKETKMFVKDFLPASGSALRTRPRKNNERRKS